MLENKDLYSYIVCSLDILNKSIILNEQNTIKLFTYLYNNDNNINDSIQLVDTNLTNKIDNYNKDIQEIRQKLQNFENIITSINKKLNKINLEINDNKNKINKLNQKSFVKNIWCNIVNCIIKIKKFIVKEYHIIYNKIYKIIFKKKIQKQKIQEEQEKIEQQRKIINQILSNKFNVNNNGH